MSHSVVQAIAIFAAGLAAGTINTVVGSGTLITFPTLLGFGYPPVLANVSNNVGLVPGALSGIHGYRAELGGQRARMLRLGSASLLGGITGAVLLLVLPQSAFKAIVPALIALALVMVVVQPWLARRVAARQKARAAEPGARRPPAGGPVLWTLVFLTGIYGGYFGAAQGILLIGLLGITFEDRLQRLNALKNVLACAVNAVAAVVFLAATHIEWTVAALIAAGSIVGGQAGARVGRRLPPWALRAVIVCVGIAALIRLAALPLAGLSHVAPRVDTRIMSDAHHAGVGQPGFVERHGLRSHQEATLAQEVAERIRTHGLRSVRLVVVDQHGQPRARALSPDAAIAALSNGLDFSGAIYSMDTGNNVFVPAFAASGGFGIPELTGFPDVVAVPDPATFRILPWAEHTGWILCDAYLASGHPVPLDCRAHLRRQLVALADKGYDFVAGLEVEFYVFRVDHGYRRTPGDAGFSPPPPPVSVFQLGYQYLSEVRLDSVWADLEAIRDGLTAVGLPPRSMEDEWGPGQFELTFAPMTGLAAADSMVLFRSAVKQICQRRGLLATFMCRPALPNSFSSGWHLHQSLADRRSGRNTFALDDPYPAAATAPLSPVGMWYVAGLLEHAVPGLPFAAPTVTGYKRYRPYSFAPDRVCWAVENRGVLVRVQGSPGDASSHVEMRSGEPAANPYLYLASSIAAGLDGITRALRPPAPVEADPYATAAQPLPASLREAVDALDGDSFYRKAFGDAFVDYLVMMKRAELARYEGHLAEAKPADPHATVTDWETREYFEFY